MDNRERRHRKDFTPEEKSSKRDYRIAEKKREEDHEIRPSDHPSQRREKKKKDS